MIRTRSIDNYLILSAFSADFIAGFFQNSAAHAYMINSANRMPSKIRFRNRATFHDMENRLIAVRLSAQQLSDPRFDDPRALVRWMGAVQAQDYKAVRWAVGIRLRTASLRAVNRALAHPVGQQLAGPQPGTGDRRRNVLPQQSPDRKNVERKPLPDQATDRRPFPGGRHCRRHAFHDALPDAGRGRRDRLQRSRPGRAVHLCAARGAGRAGSRADARRVVGRLARAYFRSHSPATASDFAWWSGLSASDVRAAIGSIRDELETLRLGDRERLIHRSWTDFPAPAPALHLLPPYDEYLIGYRDREPVLRAEHAPAAHNRWGIFYPVVLAAGRVAGNWSAARREGRPIAEVSFFDSFGPADPALVEQAVGRYRAFFER